MLYLESLKKKQRHFVVTYQHAVSFALLSFSELPVNYSGGDLLYLLLLGWFFEDAP